MVGGQSHGMLRTKRGHRTDQRDEVTEPPSGRQCVNVRQTKHNHVPVSFKVTPREQRYAMRYGHGHTDCNQSRYKETIWTLCTEDKCYFPAVFDFEFMNLLQTYEGNSFASYFIIFIIRCLFLCPSPNPK